MFVPSPPKTGTKLRHPPPHSLNDFLFPSCTWYYVVSSCRNSEFVTVFQQTARCPFYSARRLWPEISRFVLSVSMTQNNFSP